MLYRPFIPKKNGQGKVVRKTARGIFRYLLGTESEPRAGARLLSGDPALFIELCKTISGDNKYDAGCLSFDEADTLTEQEKLDTMQSYEEAIFPGLDRTRYAVVWVEHTDKGRLELNCVKARIDLATGKKLTPYYAKQDKSRMHAWQVMKNAQNGWQCPNDPSKKQTMTRPRNLPKETEKRRAMVDEAVKEGLTNGSIKSRDDLIKFLDSMNPQISVSRETAKSVSITVEGAKRAIRLTGDIYERGADFEAIAKSLPPKARLEKSFEYESKRTGRADAARLMYEACRESKLEYMNKRYALPEPEPTPEEQQQKRDIEIEQQLRRIESNTRLSRTATNRQETIRDRRAELESVSQRLSSYCNQLAERARNATQYVKRVWQRFTNDKVIEHNAEHTKRM